MSDPILVDSDAVFHAADRVVERTQDIPEAFLAALADERSAGTTARLPEAYRVASIPTAVVETWLAQGFDVFREDARAIVRRLQAENLHAFLTTTRSI